MNPSPEELEPILVELDLAPARYVTRMQGGSAPVYQVCLADGGRLVLKAFDRDQQLSGLIDFGNMRADSASMDLAKTIFCTEHDTPGSTAAILEGYGPIDHPEPDKALASSTTLHWITMWYWLRKIGILLAADAPSDIIVALRATAAAD